MMQNIIVSAVMCILLVASGHILVPANKLKKTYLILSFIGILLRIATVIYMYADGVDSVGTDGLLYHKIGIWVSSQLSQGIPLFKVRYAYTWYTVFVGLVYNIFGINRYLVSYINIAITFFSAIILLRIALAHKYSFSNASFISIAFFFFPNLVLWTADSRKEALIIFLSLLCLLFLQKYIVRETHLQDHEQASANTGKLSVIIIGIVCFIMWLCTLIRIYMFVPIAACVLISLLSEYRINRRKIHLICSFIVIVSSLLIFFLTVNPLLQNYHAIMFPEEIGDFDVDLANKVNKIKLIASNRNIFASVMNYFLLPFPGNTGIEEISGNTVLNAVVSIDMISWYACLLLIAVGIVNIIRRRKESFLLGTLAFIGLYIFINVLVVENVSDTIYRYRSVIVGPSLLFIDWNAVTQLKWYFYRISAKKANQISSP